MPRSIVTIADLTDDEIESIFDLADEFLSRMSSEKPDRISGRLDIGQPFILSTLFYEPSTRTRFSFEAAMGRLGGNAISLTDPFTSSAAKGETLADTVRVIQNYADVIVIRHPWEGAARVAADNADVPVINAGDGGHEHPTQTLCDLYTLRREKKSLEGLRVMIRGDLKNGRTVHSLVYALARFGAQINLYPAKGMELPSEVMTRLLRDFNCSIGKARDLPIDVIYATPNRPHQLALLPVTVTLENMDICYVTRLQVERSDVNGSDEYPVVDKKFLQERRFRRSQVLHPLPRVQELGYDMDADPRGIYFKQASYGVPVRMALLAALLKIGQKPNILRKEKEQLPRVRSAVPQALRCSNVKCISNEPAEKRYLVPEFWVVVKNPLTVRCIYCEREYTPKFFGNVASRHYTANPHYLESWSMAHWVFFQKEVDATAGGFRTSKERKKKTNAPV